MLFALRQRQMRPLRTWRHEDACFVSLSAMVTMTLCLCVHEYGSCVSVRAITPRGRGGSCFHCSGGPGGGRQQLAVMWGDVCVCGGWLVRPLCSVCRWRDEDVYIEGVEDRNVFEKEVRSATAGEDGAAHVNVLCGGEGGPGARAARGALAVTDT